MSDTGPRPLSIDEARRQFRLDGEKIVLDCMLVASHPAPVRRAIARYQRSIDADPDGYLRGRRKQYRVIRLLDAVARKALEYLGATLPEGIEPYEMIGLTDSTTTGISLLYNGISVLPGQEVLTTPHDFYSTRRALELRNRMTGTAVRRVPLFESAREASRGEILARLERAIGPRTRVLALTWVHSNTGVKLPIADIAALVARLNRDRAELERLLLCVDGVHGVGVETDGFDELGCDFLVFGCHKWLFGPRGTAVLCGRPSAWRHVEPTVPSLYGGRAGPSNTPGGVLAYEYRWALTEAFDFHLAMGKEAVRDHTHQMASLLKKGLDSTSRVTVVTPMDQALSSGIVCCAVEGRTPDDVVKLLRRDHGILASVSSSDVDGREYVRFSPSIHNTTEQIEQVVRTVATIATSPPRPS